MKLESPLLSTDWLATHLGDESLRIYDTTIYLRPNPDGFGYVPQSGREEWEVAHVPGAGFLDVLTELSDSTQPLPFMMPPADEFAATMAAHGVSADSSVVLHNKGAPMWSTRVWWMLRSIGFDNVAVLNGGYDKWVREGRPLTDEVSAYPAGSLSAAPRHDMWADKKDMLETVASIEVEIGGTPPGNTQGVLRLAARPGDGRIPRAGSSRTPICRKRRARCRPGRDLLRWGDFRHHGLPRPLPLRAAQRRRVRWLHVGMGARRVVATHGWFQTLSPGSA